MSGLRWMKENWRLLVIIAVWVVAATSLAVKGVNLGLELKGGTMVIAKTDHPLSKREIDQTVTVLESRLSTFGFKGIKIQPVGHDHIIVMLPGTPPKEAVELITKPGRFEAKYKGKTVITGQDIESVESPRIERVEGGYQWSVPFRLTAEGARKFAEVAKNAPGQPIDMYLDNKKVSSPRISEDLAMAAASGHMEREIEIVGGAKTKEQAEREAKEIMAVLRSGQLPAKLVPEGVYSVSATLGQNFLKMAMIAGAIAFAAVSVIIALRYRDIRISGPILFTGFSEVVFLIGLASLTGFTIDLPALAGIILSIGSGVDDLIVITDEIVRGERRKEEVALRQRIKRAFSVVLASFATLAAAMAVLFVAGMGLLKGFAIMTIAGAFYGVVITRPVYADLLKKVLGVE
ncbi:preprotein translocase subunit SecD [Methanopyrus sp.]